MHIHMEARSTAAMETCHGDQPWGAATGSCHGDLYSERRDPNTEPHTCLQMNQTVLGNAVGAGLLVGCRA